MNYDMTMNQRVLKKKPKDYSLPMDTLFWVDKVSIFEYIFWVRLRNFMIFLELFAQDETL